MDGLKYSEDYTLEIIMKGRGFLDGSDEKMRRMWLELEIVVAGLPPLVIPISLH